MADDRDICMVLEDDGANEVLEEIGYRGVTSKETAASVQNIIRFEYIVQHLSMLVASSQ